MKPFHLLSLLLATCSLSLAADGRPNIVLIMADDMGYETVNANGGKTKDGTSYDTPHLDALAASGARLTRCHSQPICTPTRVQLMTGLYNSRNYIRFGQLDPGAKTFAHYFKDKGYATMIAGKWQLDGDSKIPRHFGFDKWCLWQITARPSRHWGPGLEINGAPNTFPDDNFGPDIATSFLCKNIALQTRDHPDQPFLAYYPMILPHDPFVSTPLNADQAKDKRKASTTKFPDFIHFTDHLVGRIVAQLEESGIRDNTLVIFLGDNGTHRSVTSTFGGNPYQGGKGTTKINGTHVPGMVSWPNRIKPGQTSDALVDFSDIFPTLAEAANHPLPADHLTDGLSFLPALTGTGPAPRQWSYVYYERNGVRARASQYTHNHRYKLYSDGRFFDLQNDPREKKPLPGTTGNVHATLKAALEKHSKIAADSDPKILSLQQKIPKPTYNKKPNFN